MTKQPGQSQCLVDFHCHVDLYPDPPALIAECDRAAVRTLAVTTTPKAWPQNRDWTARSTHVRPALGIHPQLVAARHDELELFERYLPETRYVGEVGLDGGPAYRSSLPLQRDVFTSVLKLCGELGGRILSVHAVRTVREVLDLVQQHLPPDRGKIVLHWFSGSASEARRAAALGCFFSVNGEMLTAPKRLDLVKELPRDRLLTETDGPFVKGPGDVPRRPVDVAETTNRLSAVLGVSAQELREALHRNLRELIGGPDGRENRNH